MTSKKGLDAADPSRPAKAHTCCDVELAWLYAATIASRWKHETLDIPPDCREKFHHELAVGVDASQLHPSNRCFTYFWQNQVGGTLYVESGADGMQAERWYALWPAKLPMSLFPGFLPSHQIICHFITFFFLSEVILILFPKSHPDATRQCPNTGL